jgi:hypothetical protein
MEENKKTLSEMTKKMLANHHKPKATNENKDGNKDRNKDIELVSTIIVEWRKADFSIFSQYFQL